MAGERPGSYFAQMRCRVAASWSVAAEVEEGEDEDEWGRAERFGLYAPC